MKMPKLSVGGASSSPYVATLAYVGLIIVLIAAAALSAKGVLDRRAEVDGLAEILARLEGRRASVARNMTTPDAPAASGSYVLQGATVTIAGAALLQRVVGSVTRFGGSVLSSQVDLGTQAKDGVINVIASCDMEQSVLQQIVYDIEAGMPFLFVEQLSVQAPTTSTNSGNGKLRVLLSVSGQWQGPR
jgi:general secretion pathway protein M